MDGQDRDAMVDKYISLQEQEEKLDRRINDAEDERSDIAARIVGLQARLEEAEDHKAALMDEKDKTKAEKKSLQSSLNREEQLEFGFEAGRRMESKRRKQN
jgi:chromosome segregation ATPase